jgi:hypothetical protein
MNPTDMMILLSKRFYAFNLNMTNKQSSTASVFWDKNLYFIEEVPTFSLQIAWENCQKVD